MLHLLPITALVKGCGHLSCDDHLLVSQPRVEPSLPPPFGGSGGAFSIHRDNNRWGLQQWSLKKKTLEHKHLCGGCGGRGSDAVFHTKKSVLAMCTTKLRWQNTWESDSRRPHHLEPSTTNSCWLSRALPGTRRPDGQSLKNAAFLRKK